MHVVVIFSGLWRRSANNNSACWITSMSSFASSRRYIKQIISVFLIKKLTIFGRAPSPNASVDLLGLYGGRLEDILGRAILLSGRLGYSKDHALFSTPICLCWAWQVLNKGVVSNDSLYFYSKEQECQLKGRNR